VGEGSAAEAEEETAALSLTWKADIAKMVGPT
jgi:hypothetical protein